MIKKQLIFLLCILAGISCKNDPDEAKKFAQLEGVNVDIAKDVRLLHKELGKTTAVITAPTMYRYYKNENRITFPDGLQVELYENNIITCIIQAGYGERDESSKRMAASKGVTIVNYKQEKMESEEMVWEENTAQIRVDGAVKVTTPTDILNGYGLVADDRFNNYKMNKITGIVKVEGDNIPGR